MTRDYDSNAVNGVGFVREDERRRCRCGAETRAECICADELRDRERDDDIDRDAR